VLLMKQSPETMGLALALFFYPMVSAPPKPLLHSQMKLEGRNRAPFVADDRVIMPYFIGDSRRLVH
jgi:hypothetical protein